MKIELEQEHIPADLYKELGFKDWLELFDCGLEVLPRLILRPLTEEKAATHFARLKALQSAFNESATEKLLSLSKQLPFIGRVIPFLESGGLQQYHLHILGNFVETCLKLEKQETALPVSPNGKELCTLMREHLSEFTEMDYGALKIEEKEKKLKTELLETEKLRLSEIQNCEKAAQEAFGLNIIHAYPKEVPFNQELLKEIQKSPLLHCTDPGHKNGFMRIEIKPSSELLKITEKYHALEQEYEKAINIIMAKLNQRLKTFATAFTEYTERRIQRCCDYGLLFTMHRQGLSLPLISPETACRISDGRLPVLQKKAGENFKPLNVCLTPGANIIIGANMTGKTTVLKTIYFILQAFRFGLPVPCNELFSHFPTDISLLLKSSGNIDNSLSGFGCELDFFARKFPAGSVILTDELFQTTDPANGTRLAQIFITEFNRKDHLFLCSTHYAQIPELCPETKIFRMRDVDFKSKIDYHSRLRELAERIPYEIEEVSESERRENSDNSLTPLKIALIFPLAEEIKTRIKSCLQEQAEMTEEKGKL